MPKKRLANPRRMAVMVSDRDRARANRIDRKYGTGGIGGAMNFAVAILHRDCTKSTKKAVRDLRDLVTEYGGGATDGESAVLTFRQSESQAGNVQELMALLGLESASHVVRFALRYADEGEF